ncbi:MAG: MFS transporter [Stackebrandtia sp.]
MNDTPGLLRRHRDFRHVWAADALSALGSRLSMLAMPLLALLTLNATPFEVALLRTLETTAWLVLGLVAGAWMDRIACRGVLIAADIGRAVVFASVPVAYFTGSLTLAQLFVVAVLAGIGTVFFDVAGNTYLPRLLPEDDLVEANARLATNTSVAAVLASGGGGFVVQFLTAPIALAIDAASFIWSALWLRGIRAAEQTPKHPRPPHLRRDIAEGWRFVVRHPILRFLAGYSACTIFFQAMEGAVWVTFLVRDIGLSAWVIGLVGMSALLGAVGSGFVTTRIAARLGTARTMVFAAVAYAAGFAMYPLTRPGWGLSFAVAGGFLASFAIITMHILRTSVTQRLCPERLYGRVGATMEFMIWGIMPLGSLAGGIIATATSLRTTLWIIGAGIAVSILWILLSPLRSNREVGTATVQ